MERTPWQNNLIGAYQKRKRDEEAKRRHEELEERRGRMIDTFAEIGVPGDGMWQESGNIQIYKLDGVQFKVYDGCVYANLYGCDGWAQVDTSDELGQLLESWLS